MLWTLHLHSILNSSLQKQPQRGQELHNPVFSPKNSDSRTPRAGSLRSGPPTPSTHSTATTTATPPHQSSPSFPPYKLMRRGVSFLYSWLRIAVSTPSADFLHWKAEHTRVIGEILAYFTDRSDFIWQWLIASVVGLAGELKCNVALFKHQAVSLAEVLHVVHLQFVSPDKCKMWLTSCGINCKKHVKSLFWWLPSLSVYFYMRLNMFVLILTALCGLCDEPLWHWRSMVLHSCWCFH